MDMSNTEKNDTTSEYEEPESTERLQRWEPLIDGLSVCIKRPARGRWPRFRYRVRIALCDRLFDQRAARRFQWCSGKKSTDVTVVSGEGREMRSKLYLLSQCSGYFAGLARLNGVEVASRVINVNISSQTLRSILTYIVTGSIEITAKNVQQLFFAAAYLQIDSLQVLCESVLKRHVRILSDVCLNVASYSTLTDLADVTLRELCAHPRRHKKALRALNGHIISNVICQDELYVHSEDVVVDLVIDWCVDKLRPNNEIYEVLSHVRYPHLTLCGLERLLKSPLRYNIHRYLEKCLLSQFEELPEEQLTRRQGYRDHMHLVWVESSKLAFASCTRYDPGRVFIVTCLQHSGDRLYSNTILEEVRDVNPQNFYQFLPVKNTLQVLSVSEGRNEMFVNRRLDDFAWVQKVGAYGKQGNLRLDKLALCAFGGALIVRLNQREPWPFSITTDSAQINLAPSSPRTIRFRLEDRFVVLRIDVYKSYVILMGSRRIEFHDMSNSRSTALQSTTTYRGYEPDYLPTFCDMVQVGERLYVYEDIPTPHTDNKYFWNRFDKLHIFNLESKELEGVVDMKLPLWTSLTLPLRDPCHVRKLFVRGSKLIVAQQEIGVDYCKFVQFDPVEQEFTHLTDVASVDPETPYYRHLEAGLPTYLHECNAETLLQAFCRISAVDKQQGLLERFAQFLG